jgi:hypothetical protein
MRLRAAPIALDKPNALRTDRIELAMTANNTAEVDADDDGVEAVVALNVYMDLVAKGVGKVTPTEGASRLVDGAAVRDDDIVDVEGGSPLVVESLAISRKHGAIEAQLRLRRKAFELVH